MSIRPDLIAGKIEAMERGEVDASDCPLRPYQLHETLWYIQALSMAPRGLEKLCGELISRNPDSFQTAAMKAAGPAQNGQYTLAQCLGIWKAACRSDCDLGDGIRLTWISRRASNLRLFQETGHQGASEGSERSNPEGFAEWLALNIDGKITVEALDDEWESYSKANILDGLKRFNWAFLHGRCVGAAREHLASDLIDFCINKADRFKAPWYCPDLWTLLIEHADCHAGQIQETLAQTEVTRKIFQKLELARTENLPVQFVGDSRTGKTFSAAAYCAMRPGRARLVTVPSSNRFRDFIEAYADAFGIEHTPGTSTPALTDTMKYVHRHSRLLIAHDESQFLIPVNYHKSSPPPRLDFVRTLVIDRGLNCAFFATPQTYRQTLEQYVKTTGYRIEQWLGRPHPTIILPSELSEVDLTAVAKLHFPDLDGRLIKAIACAVRVAKGRLNDLAITAKVARFNAREKGRGKPDREDVLAAIQEIIPSANISAAMGPPSPIRSLGAPPSHQDRMPTAGAPLMAEDLPPRSLQVTCPLTRGEIAPVVDGE